MPGLLGEQEEEYVGYRIRARVGHMQDLLGYRCAVRVTKPDGRDIGFSEDVDYGDWPSHLPNDQDIANWLIPRGISRARAAIALDRLDGFDQKRFDYNPQEPPSKSKSDDIIHMIILTALRRLRRLDPKHTGRVALDVAGICLVEGIRKDEFLYNRQRLEDRGSVEGWSIARDDNYDSIRITEAGLQALDALERRGDVTAGGEGPPMAEEGTKEYFVAHEFSQEKTDDLRRAIDEALRDSGLTPYYADVELRQGHIFKDKILPKIRNTRFGIYDISNPDKPNVFLELGAAVALEKPHVIICKKGTPIPADIQGLDRIEYESYIDLTNQLKAKLRSYL